MEKTLERYGLAQVVISLAALALNYVAEFATDKCRFIAVPGGQEK